MFICSVCQISQIVCLFQINIWHNNLDQSEINTIQAVTCIWTNWEGFEGNGFTDCTSVSEMLTKLCINAQQYLPSLLNKLLLELLSVHSVSLAVMKLLIRLNALKRNGAGVETPCFSNLVEILLWTVWNMVNSMDFILATNQECCLRHLTFLL